MRPVRSSIQTQHPGGHTALRPSRRWNYSNTQEYHRPTKHRSILGQDSAGTGEKPRPMTQGHTAAAKIRTQDLSIQRRWPYTDAAAQRHACIYTECIFKYIGTLRVVTAREHVVLSGSFMPHSKSLKGTTTYVVMRATRDTVSNIEEWETKYPQASPPNRPESGPSA